MADIDVSDLLLDPDFTSEVTLISRAASVDEHGESVLDEVSRRVSAVVQGSQSEDLIRLPEGARLSDLITVYLRGRLHTETDDGYADVIVFDGKRYQVRTVDEDYMNFGAGYTRAICSLESV